MKRPGHKPLHSGFAQFTDPVARDAFVRETLEQDPALRGRCHLSEARPTIVFENLTARQRERVRAALDGRGRWFDDVQFRTMSDLGGNAS